MTSEEEERPRFVTGGTGVNGLIYKVIPQDSIDFASVDNEQSI